MNHSAESNQMAYVRREEVLCRSGETMATVSCRQQHHRNKYTESMR